MTKNSDNSSNTYFDNPERDQNKDFAEILNLKETYQELNKENEENMTDTMKEYYRKIGVMLDYRRQLFVDHMKNVHEFGYVDLNKNLLNFCRTQCVDLKNDYISDIEKKCIKNCSYKYLEQFLVFNNYKEDYQNRYGTQIFIFDNEQKNSINKLIDIVNLNLEQNENL